MSKQGIYQKLLSLPLLQGLSGADLTAIAERVRLDFGRVERGKYVFKAGERTQGLWFILDESEVVAEHGLSGHAVSMEECLSGAQMWGAETLFGMNQTFDCSLRALSECHTLFIAKRDVIQAILPYEVCRFNLLGYLSLRLQRAKARLGQPQDERLLRRFVELLEANFFYPAGQKKVKARMADLARCLLTTRLRLSGMLNGLEEEGLIKLGRGHFIIPRFEDLINFARNEVRQY